MDFYVDYSCENNSKTGRFKLTVSDFNTTNIRDVKDAIQDVIQAPVCDQQLFYQGQLLTDNQMTLGRLYFKEGESFELQFLAVADIVGMRKLLAMLKISAQEIVEKLNRQLPDISIIKESRGTLCIRFSHDFADLGLANAYRSVQELTSNYFAPWKCAKSSAQRHFFVQEGGFDAFLEVFKYSRQLFLFENSQENDLENESSVDAVAQQILNQMKHHFDRGQLLLQYRCLACLWNFAETNEDEKFALSKGVFPLTVDALLLQPHPFKEAGLTDISRLIVAVNESAIGCCAGFVEFDSNLQGEVSKMPSLINKLLFMINRCHAEPAGYSLFSSQVASNTLFYCTFNIKSAQPLVNCGAVDKMLNITKMLLDDDDGNTPLRYYGCLFLARIRSAPLIKLDSNMCTAIDEVIDAFLDRHIPNEISKWEEELSYVWMTMVPLVHLTFSAGKECSRESEMNDSYCGYPVSGSKLDSTQSKEACFDESQQSKATITEVAVALSAVEIRGNSKSSHQSNNNNNNNNNNNKSGSKYESLQSKEACEQTKATVTEVAKDSSSVRTANVLSSYQVVNNSKKVEYPCVTENTMSSLSEKKDCGVESRKDQFTWPGSASTQKLGIFSLVHMLSIKENQQLALSENLLPYLVCLSWHLQSNEQEKLRLSLANLNYASTPPSLKVAAKSMLAVMKGLDVVFNL